MEQLASIKLDKFVQLMIAAADMDTKRHIQQQGHVPSIPLLYAPVTH
jgi:hypothetical protein